MPIKRVSFASVLKFTISEALCQATRDMAIGLSHHPEYRSGNMDQPGIGIIENQRTFPEFAQSHALPTLSAASAYVARGQSAS